jgi:hypothetical protein
VGNLGTLGQAQRGLEGKGLCIADSAGSLDSRSRALWWAARLADKQPTGVRTVSGLGMAFAGFLMCVPE